MHYIHLVTAPRASHLTIRNVPPRVAAALKAESRRKGQSLNQTTIDLLSAATGVGQQAPMTNGLEKLAGTWSRAQFDQFEAAVADMSRVDPEMWR
jgi:plasmid stability protein